MNNRFTIATNTELIGKEVQLKLVDFAGRTVYLKSIKNNTVTIDVELKLLQEHHILETAYLI